MHYYLNFLMAVFVAVTLITAIDFTHRPGYYGEIMRQFDEARYPSEEILP